MTEYIIDFDDPRFAIEPVEHSGEIVRCRDCTGSRIFDGKRWPGKKYEGMTYCIYWSDGYEAEWTKPDGFCHRGKRKDDDR